MPEATAVADPPGWLMSIAAAYLIVWSILGIAFVVAVIYAVVKVKKLIAQVSQQVKATTEPILSTVREVRGRVDRIGETVETTVSGVARKVDTASDTFARPAALLAAFVSGVRKGVSGANAQQSAGHDDDLES